MKGIITERAFTFFSFDFFFFLRKLNSLWASDTQNLMGSLLTYAVGCRGVASVADTGFSETLPFTALRFPPARPKAP